MPPSGEQRLFGTDGIRGIAGQYPLDNETVEKIGRSIVSNLARDLGDRPAIVIGRDTRESGPQIEAALAAGAIAAGGSVQTVGVITTPGVSYPPRAIPFDAGIVISASHNPYQDNGIKVFSPSGKKLDDEMERRVEEEIDAAEIAAAGDRRRDNNGRKGGLPVQPHNKTGYQARYIDYLVNDVSRGLSLKGLRIALDCAHGAASEIAPQRINRAQAA